MITFRTIPKAFFFDRQRVQNALNKKTHQALGHIGGFVRKVAQRSIRNRSRPSRPNETPTNQTGLLKDFIFYAFDPQRVSVAIGPTRLNQVDRTAAGGLDRGLATETLEHGGKVGFFERFYQAITTFKGERLPARWVRVDQRRRRLPPGTQTRVRFATYAPRPYMGPALSKARGSKGLARYWSANPPTA